MSENNGGGEIDDFDVLMRRLRVLARINVERKVRMREDVDLMCQIRFEMLLLKAQMDTMLKYLGDHQMMTKDEYAKRHYDYIVEIIEQLQRALHIIVMKDGTIMRA